MLELSGLSKRFGSLQALDDLSLSLNRGEIVGFVGSNGAGKSTTMRIVMGVLAADSGAEDTLANLTPGLVPLDEVGHADEGPQSTDTSEAAYAAVYGDQKGA